MYDVFVGEYEGWDGHYGGQVWEFTALPGGRSAIQDGERGQKHYMVTLFWL